MLHNYNAKNAQFRILPQYKVKSEGEVVSSVLYGTVTIKNRKKYSYVRKQYHCSIYKKDEG